MSTDEPANVRSEGEYVEMRITT